MTVCSTADLVSWQVTCRVERTECLVTILAMMVIVVVVGCHLANDELLAETLLITALLCGFVRWGGHLIPPPTLSSFSLLILFFFYFTLPLFPSSLCCSPDVPSSPSFHLTCLVSPSWLSFCLLLSLLFIFSAPPSPSLLPTALTPFPSPSPSLLLCFVCSFCAVIILVNFFLFYLFFAFLVYHLPSLPVSRLFITPLHSETLPAVFSF